jgi:tetratricopeptide (TPR) repeat protein
MRLWTPGLLFLVCASPLAAQGRQGVDIKRPHLDPGRDSNSAAAYYFQGVSLLPKRPQDAAAAFYWAIRLEPGWAEPRYGRSIALLLTLNSRNLGDFFEGRDYTRKIPEVAEADSLGFQALLRNPLLDRRFDYMLVDEWVRGFSDNQVSLMDLGQGSRRFSGWRARSEGRFQDAVNYYSGALRDDPKAIDIHLDRALAYIPLLRYDSARADVSTLLGRVKELEETYLHVFASRPLLEFSIGKLFEIQGLADSAREFYSQALVTDLSFFPAHAALAALGEARGDTGLAVKEYDLAVQLSERDPALRYALGAALFDARRYEEARTQFRAAIDLDPWYAKPYFPLAYIAENTGEEAEAADFYRRYAERAPRAEASKIAYASDHAAQLSHSAPDSAHH